MKNYNLKKIIPIILKFLQTLLYLFMGFITQILFYCFTNDYSLPVVSFLLFIGILLSFLLLKQKTDNIIDTIIKYIPLPLFIIIGVLFYIARSINSPITKVIDILGKKSANFIHSLLNNPEFYCKPICKLLEENILYIQVIIFFLIALIPLYSTCKIVINIIKLWSK
ncbi:hypothetical protein BKK51_04270 [Rodentibacter trehalosifermentans]|uniref:Uncharacterized protein n=1 Tax=Rodentibacter trehalosifermentans TaxID=1908263 RepID=A0A1V3IV55_9PAST|nr:hypothetical protein BKK52_12445 [Rodentibacter trehalosifermentans]OOF46075.1 hypothetical protein BKK51_04270 [Rodentibacter trehalosifermentans]